METKLTEYRERKPRFLRMVMWRLINMTVFRILPNAVRILLLRLMGAHIGKRCLIYGSAKIYVPWNLTMGDAVCFGPRVEIYNKNKITIGNGVIVSQDAWLCTASHDITDPRMALTLKPISIGNDVWIAARGHAYHLSADHRGRTRRRGCQHRHLREPSSSRSISCDAKLRGTDP